jgi:hypothetical protein
MTRHALGPFGGLLIACVRCKRPITDHAPTCARLRKPLAVPAHYIIPPWDVRGDWNACPACGYIVCADRAACVRALDAEDAAEAAKPDVVDAVFEAEPDDDQAEPDDDENGNGERADDPARELDDFYNDHDRWILEHRAELEALRNENLCWRRLVNRVPGAVETLIGFDSGEGSLIPPGDTWTVTACAARGMMFDRLIVASGLARSVAIAGVRVGCYELLQTAAGKVELPGECFAPSGRGVTLASIPIQVGHDVAIVVRNTGSAPLRFRAAVIGVRLER